MRHDFALRPVASGSRRMSEAPTTAALDDLYYAYDEAQGGPGGDGVELSDDGGTTWHHVWDAPTDFDEYWKFYDVDLSSAAALGGVTWRAARPWAALRNAPANRDATLACCSVLPAAASLRVMAAPMAPLPPVTRAYLNGAFIRATRLSKMLL